jgi:hypothetical protein
MYVGMERPFLWIEATENIHIFVFTVINFNHKIKVGKHSWIPLQLYECSIAQLWKFCFTIEILGAMLEEACLWREERFCKPLKSVPLK